MRPPDVETCLFADEGPNSIPFCVRQYIIELEKKLQIVTKQFEYQKDRNRSMTALLKATGAI